MRQNYALVVAFLILSCHQNDKKSGQEATLYKNIKKHNAELSSDRCLDRMPMSSTEGITVDYIATQIKKQALIR